MRKLATIRTISAINPHPNADRLELATIDGWTCVVKKGEFKASDIVTYLEIDSFIPSTVAPFLTKTGSKPKTYNGIAGERLRTIKLRGVVSQGLVLPLTCLPEAVRGSVKVGDDVSETLTIEKYEKPLSPQLAGLAKGTFPSFIRKTDQPRIQNIHHTLTPEQLSDVYEVTLKMDGSSATFFVKDGQTGVCSRNLELKIDEENKGNSFVKKFKDLDLQIKLENFHAETGRNIAVQGELYGSGINGNHEGINDHRFNVFDVFDIDTQSYLAEDARHEIVKGFDLDHVPVIETCTLESFKSVDDFLAYADMPSIYNKVAEGCVLKSTTSPDFSFKIVNTKFLLNGGE